MLNYYLVASQSHCLNHLDHCVGRYQTIHDQRDMHSRYARVEHWVDKVKCLYAKKKALTGSKRDNLVAVSGEPISSISHLNASLRIRRFIARIDQLYRQLRIEQSIRVNKQVIDGYFRRQQVLKLSTYATTSRF